MDENVVVQQLYEQYDQLRNYVDKLQKGIEELNFTKESLLEFDKLKGDEEILAPISEGIFISAKMQGKKELYLNIGSKTVVAKNVLEAIDLLDRQEKELSDSKTNAQSKLDELRRILQG